MQVPSSLRVRVYRVRVPAAPRHRVRVKLGLGSTGSGFQLLAGAE